MTDSSNFTNIDSGARVNSTNLLQQAETLDAVKDGANKSIRGTRQDSPFGTQIPVLIFNVFEIGHAQDSKMPHSLEPKIQETGTRHQKSTLEFRGIASRGLGALNYGGHIKSIGPVTNTLHGMGISSIENHVLMKFFVNGQTRLPGTGEEDSAGRDQGAFDYQQFRAYLNVAPLIARATIHEGDNYGFIEEFEELRRLDDTGLRDTEESELSTRLGSHRDAGRTDVLFNDATKIKLRNGTSRNKKIIKVASVPAPAPSPTPKPAPAPAPPSLTENQIWAKRTEKALGLPAGQGLGNPLGIDIVTFKDTYGRTLTLRKDMKKVLLDTQKFWENARAYIKQNKKIDIGKLLVKPGEDFRISRNKDGKLTRKQIKASSDKSKRFTSGLSGSSHNYGHAVDFEQPYVYRAGNRSRYRKNWIDLAVHCAQKAGFLRVGISISGSTLHADQSKKNWYVYIKVNNKTKVSSTAAAKLQGYNRLVLSDLWFNGSKGRNPKTKMPDLGGLDWKNLRYG